MLVGPVHPCHAERGLKRGKAEFQPQSKHPYPYRVSDPDTPSKAHAESKDPAAAVMAFEVVGSSRADPFIILTRIERVSQSCSLDLFILVMLSED